MKKRKPMKASAKSKPAKRDASKLMNPLRRDARGGRREKPASDWHPLGGPFPTD